jgi:ubiquinone/menaquinone biosynthesis C-methylase UbiE
VSAERKPFLWEAAVRYGVSSRERKWHRYEATFPPKRGERVLDVGVSTFDDYPGENYFLKRYPYRDQVTGVGISDLAVLRKRYPEVTFLEADGRRLPFPDSHFDRVHSNAVIEHVGPPPEQRRFVHELVRVSRAGFLTTPSRWFPIEAHRHWPLLHWLPRGVSAWYFRKRTGEDFGVWLLSGRTFLALFPPSVETELAVQRLLAWPATLIVTFRKPM